MGTCRFQIYAGAGRCALLSVSAVVVYECFQKKNATASHYSGWYFYWPNHRPDIGGYITENFSWPWIFYINIPIGIAAAISCFFLLYESPVRQKIKQIDWVGIFLLIAGIGSLQTVLERGETDDWFSAAYIIVLSIVAAISLIGFIIWELRIENPIVNLKILKYRSLSIAAVLTFITGMGMYTSIYLTPVVAQRLLGFTPTQSGLLLLPGSIVAVLALIITGKLCKKEFHQL